MPYGYAGRILHVQTAPEPEGKNNQAQRNQENHHDMGGDGMVFSADVISECPRGRIEQILIDEIRDRALLVHSYLGLLPKASRMPSTKTLQRKTAKPATAASRFKKRKRIIT